MLEWKVGDVSIRRVVELETDTIGRLVLPQVGADELAAINWIAPFVSAAGRMQMSIATFVVESQGQRILVDTCIGNDKQLALRDWANLSGPFLADLAAAGAPRESVDLVMCTHLHVDHVGWNTMKVDDVWVPTFPNARYLFARKDFDYWKGEPEDMGPVLTESVLPVLDAGLADLVDTEHALTDEVWMEPTPGHTPGHVSVHIASRGEHAVITGDMVHHPCQLAHPEWSAAVDWDKEMSHSTRQAFFSRYADQPVLIIGTHFAAPTAGRIVRDGKAFRLDC